MTDLVGVPSSLFSYDGRCRALVVVDAMLDGLTMRAAGLMTALIVFISRFVVMVEGAGGPVMTGLDFDLSSRSYISARSACLASFFFSSLAILAIVVHLGEDCFG